MKERYNRTYFEEMANISKEITGLKKGYIQIYAELRHPLFPHIHFVYDLKKVKTEYAKFTINNNIEEIKIIKDTLSLTNKEIKDIKNFISKNADILLNYYDAGKTLDTYLFLKSLKKI